MARIVGNPAKRPPPARLPRRLLHLRSDDRLVAMVRDGDDVAFDVLYERHADGLLAFCGQMLESRSDAEEALRHSFAAARFYIARDGRDVAFEPWLYTIAGNYCLTVLRDRRGAPPRPVERIDEWRHRPRGRLGLALPAAPALALQQGVAAVGGPGVVAKAAVVVGVLAGGAGVTTEAVRQDRGGAAAAPPAIVEPRQQSAPDGCIRGCGRHPAPGGGDSRARKPHGPEPTAERRARALPRSRGAGPRDAASPESRPDGALTGDDRLAAGDPAWRPASATPAPAGADAISVAPPPVVAEVDSRVKARPPEAPAGPEVGEDEPVTVKVPPVRRPPLPPHARRPPFRGR